jgi:hypothetical protein
MIKEMERLTIRADLVVRALWITTAVLAVVSVLVQIVVYVIGWGHIPGLSKLDVSVEASIPTYFSAVLFLASSLLLGLIAHHTRRAGGPFAKHWLALSLLFLLLSVDEIVSIHEGLTEPMRALFQTSGFLYYAWVIPGAIFVAALSALYFRFVLHLPPATRRLFVLAAAVFVGGALGVEMIGGNYAATHGVDNLTYNMISSVEETMEMSGLVIFIHAMLQYIAGRWPESSVHVRSGKGPESTPTNPPAKTA